MISTYLFTFIVAIMLLFTVGIVAVLGYIIFTNPGRGFRVAYVCLVIFTLIYAAAIILRLNGL